MSEQPERAKRDDVIVFTASARGFPGDVIEQLKAKYGLEVEVWFFLPRMQRSTKLSAVVRY